jgi:outer membrane receptor for ferrienterochelin and colicins
VTHLARLLLLLFVVAALPPPASAQTEEAEVLFARGNRALERSQRLRGVARTRALEEALDAYAACLRIVRSRNVLFNLAVTLEQLDRPMDAFNAYSDYLAIEGLSEDQREAGVGRRDALRARVAVLAVDSDPRGAEVRVDRADLPVEGHTPVEIAVPPGPHRLLLTLDAHEATAGVGEAVLGARRAVRVTLAPSPVAVQILAPSGFPLLLDGAPFEAGRSAPLAPGPHVARLEVPGRPPVERAFEVPVGSPPMVIELDGPTTPGDAFVRLIVDTDADVLVDGNRVGMGSALVLDVPPGSHDLRLVAPGRGAVATPLELAPGETVALRATLGELPDATTLDLFRGLSTTVSLLALATAGVAGSFALAAANERDDEVADVTGAGTVAERQAAWERWRDAEQRHERYGLVADVAGPVALGFGVLAIILAFVQPGGGREGRIEVLAEGRWAGLGGRF